MKSFAPVYKRCKPLLGTFVEITLISTPDFSSSFTLSFSSREFLDQVCGSAFAEIERISDLMSFHSAVSELSRLNALPLGKWMTASESLAEVLTLALELQNHTGGIFNVAVGRPLVQWGLLPEHSRTQAPIDSFPGKSPGFEVKGLRVRRLLDVKIDLGGIAKGYAVDRAVRVIQNHGPSLSGCVNAGGDLRVFGEQDQTVQVRTSRRSSAGIARFQNGAIATSTIQVKKIESGKVSAYLNPKTSRAVLKKNTAVARAESCMIADAFTKIALLTTPAQLAKFSHAYAVSAQVLA